MKLVSFNINGIRARLHQLAAIVDKHQPDVIGLQETKVDDAQFPEEAVRELGYEVYYHGQKAHYGVALLARQPLEDIRKGFPDEPPESQTRLIAGSLATAQGAMMRIYNGYFPQGENRAHPEKFPNKAWFYSSLLAHLQQNHSPEDEVVVMGDMNISPDDKDIGIGEANRKRWLRQGKCSFLPEEREWMQRLYDWGLVDSFRALNPEVNDRFSWFDYRSKGFDDDPRRGLRIDHILLTPPLVDKLVDAGIDYEIRGMEKPSDHCPIWVTLSD